MALIETWLQTDLKKPVQVIRLQGNLFSGDNQGNLIGFEVLDNGSAAELTGGVTGYIIRADGATVTVVGTLSGGNRCSIILPSSAYVIPGQTSIVVKNGTMTVGACVAYVYKTTTDTLVDPGHVIPSIDELLAKIADCEAATAAAMKVAMMTVSAEAASGSTPTATLTEEGSGALAHKHLTFGLVPGEDGVSPTVVVTQITGGHQVTITDTEPHTFNVMDGVDGQDGDDGDDGVNAYVYIRWAANQPTQDSDMSTTPNDWMGVYGGSASSAPIHYTDYQWYKVKGETGTAQNVYGSTVPMSPSDSTKVETAINGKLAKPATAGTAGQVLTSDGQGGQSWQTPSGGTVTDVQEDGVSILSSGVANILTMTGAGASAAGTKGLVPAPSAGDQAKVLTGDGSWTAKTGANIPMSGTDNTAVKDAIEAIANVVTEVPLTITPSDWASTSPYAYTWTDARVLADSSIEVEFLDTSVEAGTLYLSYEKASGGGGIVFTPSSLPTENVAVLIVITNAQAHSGSSIDADTVATEAVSGAANVEEALSLHTDAIALKDHEMASYVIDGDTCASRISKNAYVLLRNSTITGLNDGFYKSGATINANTQVTAGMLSERSIGYEMKVISDAIANIPVIKTDSFTGTTSGSGNVSKAHAKKVIVLSAWTDGSDRIVTPFPGSGSGATGQYTWWFQVFSDNSSHSVIANTSVTIYYAYIQTE